MFQTNRSNLQIFYALLNYLGESDPILNTDQRCGTEGKGNDVFTVNATIPRSAKCLQAALLCAASLACAAVAGAEPRGIDAAKSTMTVHVGKSGVFSTFGHNHVIAA